MNTAAYELEPVDALGPAGTDEVRRIYEGGFAPHLRSGFASLTTGREPGEVALALVHGGQPRGFALLRPLGGTGWMFLRYLVVDQRVRGQGLGGIIWDRLVDRLRADGYTLLVFDVEDPGEPGCDPAEVRIRHRRIGFYERHGARLLPVQGYGNPHGDADGSSDQDWTPMRLMAAPVAAGTPAPGASEAPGIVAAVYRYRYRLDPGHHRVTATRVTPDAGQPAADDQKGL